jgi:hypothetical protein
VKKKILISSLLSSMVFASVGYASEWGCQVLLCLSNPAGPEAVSECVPPIEKLWDALEDGDPFPNCDEMGSSGSSNYGNHVWASGNYCHPDLITYTNVFTGMFSCKARGAVNVVINGQPNTRVWWGVPSSTGVNGRTTLLETTQAMPGVTPAPLVNPATAKQTYIQKNGCNNAGILGLNSGKCPAQDTGIMGFGF